MKKLTKIQVDLFKRFVDIFDVEVVYEGKIITFEDAMIVLEGDRPNDKTIDERKENFKATLAPYVEEYGYAMINKFDEYWTRIENNKLKFETHGKTWTLKLRLAKWNSNNEERLRDNYIKEVSKRF